MEIHSQREVLNESVKGYNGLFGAGCYAAERIQQVCGCADFDCDRLSPIAALLNVAEQILGSREMFRAVCLRHISTPRSIPRVSSLRTFKSTAIISSEKTLENAGAVDVAKNDDDVDWDADAVPDDEMWDLSDTITEFKQDDSTSIGHLILRQRRQTLKYLRLVELEVPYLAGTSPFTIISLSSLHT